MTSTSTTRHTQRAARITSGGRSSASSGSTKTRPLRSSKNRGLKARRGRGLASGAGATAPRKKQATENTAWSTTCALRQQRHHSFSPSSVKRSAVILLEDTGQGTAQGTKGLRRLLAGGLHDETRPQDAALQLGLRDRELPRFQESNGTIDPPLVLGKSLQGRIKVIQGPAAELINAQRSPARRGEDSGRFLVGTGDDQGERLGTTIAIVAISTIKFLSERGRWHRKSIRGYAFAVIFASKLITPVRPVAAGHDFPPQARLLLNESTAFSRAARKRQDRPAAESGPPGLPSIPSAERRIIHHSELDALEKTSRIGFDLKELEVPLSSPSSR